MESRPETPQLEEFRIRFEQELTDLLDSGIFEEEPLAPDPSSMGMGETTLEELHPDELLVVEKILHQKLGVNPEDQDALQRRYSSQAPEEATAPGEIKITVFKTKREGTYLQEMIYTDGQKRWVIGPDINI